MTRSSFVVACVLLLAVATTVSALNCAVNNRVDCGYVGINAQQCQDKGCCWSPAGSGSSEPWCFEALVSAPVYTVSNLSESSTGFVAQLSLSNPGSGTYGPALANLQLTAVYETDSRVHFRLTDPSNARYEIPQSALPYPAEGSRDFPRAGTQGAFDPETPLFTVATSSVGSTLSLSVTRVSDGVVLFDLADLEYSNQFLQMSTMLPASGGASPNLYGLGDHVMQFQLPTNDHSFTMWNVDIPTPYDQNIYGSHPFYLQTLPGSGAAHGVFVRSSNGMDVIVNTNKIQFRIIGGILEFYVFTGPTQEQVIQQYHGVIGRPHLPPYWSMGWHQCKYGWKSLQEVETVVATYASHGIPLDTIWGDIDYMDAFEDFSWDPVNYPQAQVAAFANQLHQAGQQYVVIVDPGIHNRTGYAPYDQGLAQGLFIMNGDGETPFIGNVWPGDTAFPDFLNPDTPAYWADQIKTFLTGVPYDGLWIDMNEISNNWAGGAYNPNAAVNNPPYAINNFNNRAALNTRTVAMDALHNKNTLQEYDVHNLFGLTEAIATRQALESIQGKRAFILTRSTFPGSGVHAAHWLGDNHATYDDLYRSIPGILNMNMYGIPMVGADICGFINPTTEELCARWTALGAFYPFSRNHHEPQESQEPYLWPSVEAVAKKVLAMRYSLLPTLYTLFAYVNQNGGTVARSLMFNFPTDSNTYSIDTQFMWGSQLLVTPVLTQGAESVKGYFPPAQLWYDAWNLTALDTSSSSDGWIEMPCAIADAIVLHIAGGSILPMQAPEMTTAQTRQNAFELVVALDANQAATGSLFWDDGTDMDGRNIALTFAASGGSGSSGLTWSVQSNTFQGSLPMLQTVSVAGFTFSPSSLAVNGVAMAKGSWTYSASEKILVIDAVNAALTNNGQITWTA